MLAEEHLCSSALGEADSTNDFEHGVYIST